MSWSKDYAIAAHNFRKLDGAIRADATIGDGGSGWKSRASFEGETIDTFVGVSDTALTISRASTPSAGEIAALDAVVAAYDTSADPPGVPVQSFTTEVVTNALGTGWTELRRWTYRICNEAPGADDGHAMWVLRCAATASGTGAELRIVEDDLVSPVVVLNSTPATIPNGGPAILEMMTDGNMSRDQIRVYRLQGRLDGSGGPAASASVEAVTVCLAAL